LHETSGLVRTAQAESEIEKVETSITVAARELEGAGVDLANRQQRLVDVNLRRTRPAAVGVPTDSEDRRLVLRNTTLASGGRYQLSVNIGAALPGSLMTGERQSIDAVLEPSSKGHVLDFSVFGHDFGVESPSVVQRLLASAGPTDIVTFTVRAPTNEGPARLRIVISYLDHVLHSYVLSATVRSNEQSAEDWSPVTVALEFATSRRFGNLEELGPRSVAIIANVGPKGDARLGVKSGGSAIDLSFDAGTMRTMREQFRALLGKAADDGATFPEPPGDGAAAEAERAGSYDALMRELAILGAGIHKSLSDLGARDVLRKLLRTDNQVIQVVEAKRGGSLPWLVVYDGRRPTGAIAEMVSWPLCRGFDANGAACTHRYADTDGLVCLRRMWGVRHRVELRLAAPAGTETQAHDAPGHVGRGNEELAIAVGRSSATVFDGPVPSALDELKGVAGVSLLPAGQDVYQRLRDAERARVFAVLGHLDVQAAPGGVAPTTLIDLLPKPLSDSALSQALDEEEEDWGEPFSIVVLLTCTSNHVPGTALSGIVDTFLSAGASAVIGTETVVFPRLSARFLKFFFSTLSLPQTSFVDAVTEARLAIMRRLNPLALSFVGWGSADLFLSDSTKKE
jgi:hypothetical protein